jgi:hypothetical protein
MALSIYTLYLSSPIYAQSIFYNLLRCFHAADEHRIYTPYLNLNGMHYLVVSTVLSAFWTNLTLPTILNK